MRVILVDGKNAAFRFTWAYRALSDDAGNPTGAVYGLYRMLLGIKKKYPDARFVVAWDGQRTPQNWRCALYPGYKLRSGVVPKTVTDVLCQIPKMEEALACVGIPSIRVDDVEADDLAGMFSTICLKLKWEPIIYSSDMDYAQLLQYGVGLIRGDRDDPFRLTRTQEICDRFHCSLENVLRVRALMGDQSDKIPKVVRGLGIEMAASLIEDGWRPESLNGAKPFGLAKLGQGKTGKLNDYWQDVHRNYRLMRIVRSWRDPVYAHLQNKLKRQMRIARDGVLSPIRVDGHRLTQFLTEGQFVSLLRERRRLMQLNT
jgi:5'-3' exonuclease